MSKEKIKYPGLLNKFWYDPIWSKVLYSLIIFLAGLIYTFIATLFKDRSFKDVFWEVINFDVKVYVIFIVLAVSILLWGILHKIQKRRNAKIGKFDVEQKIGYFTFRELYNAMITHQLEAPIELRKPGVIYIDLLTLFTLYQRQLNMGARWEHDTFTYYVLGSTLMSYGLTEKVPTTDKDDTLGMDIIQTSPVGFEFLSMLERFRVYNNLNMEDDITKTGSLKPDDRDRD